MEQTNEQEQLSLDLATFVRNSLFLLRRTFYLVLLAALLGGALLGWRAWRSYSPRYQAQAVLSVSAGYSGGNDLTGYGSYYDSAATQQVISTFPALIDTDAMRQLITQELGTAQINGSISAEVVASSNLFTLTVTSSSAQDAYDILNAVLVCYPKLASVVIGSTTVELIEEPVLPEQPVNSPGWRHSAVRGAVLGGVLMLALLCLLAQLRKTVTSEEDMKQLSSLSCLAQVPATTAKRRQRGDGRISLLSPTVSPAYAESIRTLRARLLHERPEGGVVLVTSTAPGEGKSTLAANLAISLAHAGHSVILVDGDLRAQSLRTFFSAPEDAPALAALLADPKLDPVACLQQTEQKRLRLLTGAGVNEPTGLLRQHRLKELLARLEQEAEYILLDTPPAGLLADAMAFARLSDLAIFVVRCDYAARMKIADSLQALADTRVKLLGYVLNRTAASGGRYGYGYGYGHGYGYGYGKGYGGYGYGKKRRTSGDA